MKKITLSILGIAIGAIATIVYLLNSGTVGANPSQLPIHNNCVTAAYNYLNVANATTTLSCDSYALDTNYNVAYAMNSATLVLKFEASSTASVLSVDLEYSNDNSSWYKSNLAVAATSTVTKLGLPEVIEIAPASTTANVVGRQGLTTANSATTTRILSIPTPTRYVRAIFTTANANGNIVAEFIPKQEVR